MVHEADLVQKAQQALGDDHHVLAAGVFGLQDNYGAIMVGGLAGGAIAQELPGGSVTDAATAAASVYVTRQVMADAKGVSVRMLVAVTDAAIVLFALDSVGTTPHREVMRFGRATTTCKESKFGASRHLTLNDSATGQEIGLTGSAAFFSAYAEGDKAVLAELDSN